MKTTDNMKTKQQDKYQYSGDVNIEYGGTYFELNDSDWGNGYVSAIRVTDLDSGCGFTGAVLIEKIVILINPDQFENAASCCGFEMSELNLANDGDRLRLADALMSYGCYDPDENYYSPSNEVIQTQDDGPMEFDGWKAAKRVLSENLEGYVSANYLN